MAKTLSAMAVARSLAETRLTMAALIGPVDRNRQSCAITMYAMYRVCDAVVSASHTKGAAMSVAIADSHR